MTLVYCDRHALMMIDGEIELSETAQRLEHAVLKF